MRKLTFPEIHAVVTSTIEGQFPELCYLTKVTQKAGQIMTFQFSKITHHGERVFTSFVISYKDVDPEEWGVIYNYYKDLARYHRKIAKG